LDLQNLSSWDEVHCIQPEGKAFSNPICKHSEEVKISREDTFSFFCIFFYLSDQMNQQNFLISIHLGSNKFTMAYDQKHRHQSSPFQKPNLVFLPQDCTHP
jgi:hypothetical protein